VLLIAVHLHAHEGNITALRSFEEEALALVRQFGGELLAAFKPANADNSADIPDEIHLLRFPSQAAFDAYRNSPETAALAPKRTAAIRKTVIFLSEEIITY
jgi:uncharacterized protein (DUF1330 family)